jgi:hypothetical protein
MKRYSPYPDVLPEIDPAWIAANGRRVEKVALTIAEEASYREVVVLADALEEAGCADEVILQHLRDVTHDRGCAPGCWERVCWLVNLVLKREQPVVASFTWPSSADDPVHEATAINPGGCQGATWLVYVGDCFSPPMYAVEAENAGEAIDEFVDSDYGKSQHVDPENEYDNDDYGYEVHAGDQFGGNVYPRDGWVDLRGNYVDEERREPGVTSGGTLYDGDNIQVHGADVGRMQLGNVMPFKFVYHGPGLPAGGISPLRYWRRTECRQCGKSYFPEGKFGDYSPDDFCSPGCAAECGF